MELTASNVIKSLSEIAPYIEADGGFVEFVEIEERNKVCKSKIRWCLYKLCNECYDFKTRYTK